MASSIEVKERQKHHLASLLSIKRDNPSIEIVGLNREIEKAVTVMEQEDVAWVEKIIGVTAL